MLIEKRDLKAALVWVSNDTTRVGLTGVALLRHSGRVILAATDGTAGIMLDVAPDAGEIPAPCVILARETLANAIKGSGRETHLELELGAGGGIARANGASWVLATVDAQFPPLEDVMRRFRPGGAAAADCWGVDMFARIAETAELYRPKRGAVVAVRCYRGKDQQVSLVAFADAPHVVLGVMPVRSTMDGKPVAPLPEWWTGKPASELEPEAVAV